MITLEQYFMGRDEKYICDPEFKVNASILLARVNALLEGYTAATGNVVTGVNSGWRPPAINACTAGASKTSYHMIGKAIDLRDDDEALDTWLMTPLGTHTMEVCQLWHEANESTPRWAHLQSEPPRSGNRTFHP